MENKFALIGCSGLVVSVVCLTAAATIGGNMLKSQNIDWGRLGDFQFGRPACPADSGVTDSRAFAWSGGDRVEIDLPANADYHRGSGDQLVVKGERTLLSHVTLRNGRIRLDCNNGGGRLDVTLPGRDFRTFSLNGSGSLKLYGLQQDALTVNVAGSGDVEGDGKVQVLNIRIAGSGAMRLGALAAERVDVKIAGSGDVETAPSERLRAVIAGSGSVTLKTEPRNLDTSIAGSGRIIHADGSVSSMHGLQHHSQDGDDDDGARTPDAPKPAPLQHT